MSFKPYYKWNTFNTCYGFRFKTGREEVLNLIINGIPSIPSDARELKNAYMSF